MPLIGVVLGSFIAAFTSWSFKRSERRAEYAIKNRKDIYGPLYKETVALHAKLDEFAVVRHVSTDGDFGIELPRAYGRFQHWSRMREDDRAFRIAADIREKVIVVWEAIERYNRDLPAAVQAIDEAVNGSFAAVGATCALVNIGEVLTEQALESEGAVPEDVRSACVRSREGNAHAAGTAALEDGLRKAQRCPEVGAAVASRDELRAAVVVLELGLKDRLEEILRRYEGKLPRL